MHVSDDPVTDIKSDNCSQCKRSVAADPSGPLDTDAPVSPRPRGVIGAGQKVIAKQ